MCFHWITDRDEPQLPITIDNIPKEWFDEGIPAYAASPELRKQFEELCERRAEEYNCRLNESIREAARKINW